MKLLICAQAVDRNDKELSFFLLWLRELAKHYEQVTVICLRRGEYELPQNVRVFALGGGKMARAYKLLKGAYRFRNNYDAVLVHQGQEFALVAGLLWRLYAKPVYMWRNHYAGSWLTDIAAAFCAKVFCTSVHSYTAKYKKTVLMPVGVDTESFRSVPGVQRNPNSILFLARMSPSKRPEMLLGALKRLRQESRGYSAAIVGSPLPSDAAYYESLKESAQELGSAVAFSPGIPNDQTPALYSAHQIFVNCSRSGMYDKTLFEAAACGCLVLAASDDWGRLAGSEYQFNDTEDLASKLGAWLALPQAQLQEKILHMEAVAREHSLKHLAERLAGIIKGEPGV